MDITGAVLEEIGRSRPYAETEPISITAETEVRTTISNNVIAETGWGTDLYTLNAKGNGWVDGGYLYGAGGGYSTLFPRPAWQASTVPTSAPTGRAVPDIASIADPQTGMLVGQSRPGSGASSFAFTATTGGSRRRRLPGVQIDSMLASLRRRLAAAPDTTAGTSAQHSMTLTARPPSLVSLYLVDMSIPVWRIVSTTASSET